MQQVASTAELIDFIKAAETVRVVGGGTKPALCHHANVGIAPISGVVEYQPGEYTVTVRAGTRLTEIHELLAERKQYLPCDLPLADAGSTIGGAVAAGVSGPGRFRYGGLRDFLLGVELVTGDGVLVRLGSRVVKNAAGFDFPKLMVGSLGRLGVMTELTLKVFPRPAAYRTLIFETPGRQEAVRLILQLGAAPLDLERLDLVDGREVWAQIGGDPDATTTRAERLTREVDLPSRPLGEDEAAAAWEAANCFAWTPAEHSLVKIAVTPSKLVEIGRRLDPLPMRGSAGAHVLWVAWPETRAGEELDRMLKQFGLSGLALSGGWENPLLGRQPDPLFTHRLSQALDPAGKFASKFQRAS